MSCGNPLDNISLNHLADILILFWYCFIYQSISFVYNVAKHILDIYLTLTLFSLLKDADPIQRGFNVGCKTMKKIYGKKWWKNDS